MKKLISIFLLFCVLFTTLAYSFIIHLQLSEAKAEMKARIEHISDYKSVTQLQLNREELENLVWENESEFTLNGAQYDLLEKHWQKDKMIIHCISDTRETALINEYYNSTKNRESSDNLPSVTLLKLLNTHFILSDAIQIQPFISLKTHSQAIYSFHIPLAPKSIITPPPQI